MYFSNKMAVEKHNKTPSDPIKEPVNIFSNTWYLPLRNALLP